jgi:hypothetical protein
LKRKPVFAGKADTCVVFALAISHE